MKNKIEKDDMGNMSKNSYLLRKFVGYCLENPDLRFWQALINWAGFDISKVVLNKNKVQYIDLFYEE